MHPNAAQRATVERTATLGQPRRRPQRTYVADTRAIYDHKVHLVREALGTAGTDADRLKRYAEAISGSRSHAARVRYRGDPVRQLPEDAGR